MSKGTFYKLNVVDDKAKTKDSVRKPVSIETRKYEVIAESGVFKNGKLYKRGDKIELVKATGENFIKAGEVKELK